MINVHQVRLGFATNSSSSHSLIILPNGAKDREIRGGEFGWQNFTAGSREAKSLYLAVQLRDGLALSVGKEDARELAQLRCGVSLSCADEYGRFDEYIDHESIWSLPRAWAGRGIDMEFFNELKQFVLRDDVVILGGNDNDGPETHPLYNENAFELPLEWGPLVARKDNGYWSLFDRSTGTKIRLSLTTGQKIKPKRASAPELVDIKITDFCTRGCEYCYQDSSPAGKHADLSQIEMLAYYLGQLRVFEVALGGGEPTAHPRFTLILDMFMRNGIVPNFTTRDLSWFHDHTRRVAIMEKVGAFAYSVDTPEEVKNFAAACHMYGVDRRKVAVQFVMGAQCKSYFSQVLRAADKCDMRLTLLGFKTDGRGESFRQRDYGDWVSILAKRAKAGTPHVGIDTALARDYQPELKSIGVPSWCYEVDEGAFSMYIDAVRRTTAPASYGGHTPRPFDIMQNGHLRDGADQIRAHFAEAQ